MKADKLSTVASITKSDQQKSALVLKSSQENVKQQNDQLTQLLSFKDEYEQRLQSLGSQGINARQLQDYRQFLVKLNQAIDAQRDTVEKANRQFCSDQEKWQKKTHRHTAMENLIDQNQQQKQYKQQKKDQQEADERFLASPAMGAGS